MPVRRDDGEGFVEIVAAIPFPNALAVIGDPARDCFCLRRVTPCSAMLNSVATEPQKVFRETLFLFYR
jgi:hypothetical protein